METATTANAWPVLVVAPARMELRRKVAGEPAARAQLLADAFPHRSGWRVRTATATTDVSTAAAAAGMIAQQAGPMPCVCGVLVAWRDSGDSQRLGEWIHLHPCVVRSPHPAIPSGVWAAKAASLFGVELAVL